MQCGFLHSGKGLPDWELLPRPWSRLGGRDGTNRHGKNRHGAMRLRQNQKRREDLLRRFAVLPPVQHRSGGARQALPCATCSKCFFGKSCHAPPGLFLMAAVGSGCWTDAWVLPPPQRALQSRTAPPKVTGLRFTATGPAKTVRYTASQPRPARSFPKDGPPESPLNRHGRSIRAGGRGVDKISLLSRKPVASCAAFRAPSKLICRFR